MSKNQKYSWVENNPDDIVEAVDEMLSMTPGLSPLQNLFDREVRALGTDSLGVISHSFAEKNRALLRF